MVLEFLEKIRPKEGVKANVFIVMYHVRCLEELLDLSSPHYVARFEPDRQKHSPNEGAQRILEEYICRWKFRLSQGNNYESDPQQLIAEVLIKDIPTTVAESTTKEEQQLPGQRIPADAKVPAAVHVTFNGSSMPTPSTSSVTPASDANQIKSPNPWTIGDEVWGRVRQAEAARIQKQEAAVREHEAVFSGSPFLSISMANYDLRAQS